MPYSKHHKFKRDIVSDAPPYHVSVDDYGFIIAAQEIYGSQGQSWVAMKPAIARQIAQHILEACDYAEAVAERRGDDHE